MITATDPFAALEQAQAALPRVEAGGGLPVPPPVGLAGWVSYEAGQYLERLPPPRSGGLSLPQAAFGVYGAGVVFDHALRAVTLCWLPGHDAAAQALGEAVTHAAARPVPPPPSAPKGVEWRPSLTRAEVEARIAATINYIHAGDIFQANITQSFHAMLPPGVDAYGVYRRLIALSPAPFAAFLRFGGGVVASASPERFLRLSPGGQVETRPIKGTRPRGKTPQKDAAWAEALRTSPKDRAENLMIVDLLRNDISRVCLPGTVEVPVLCGLETFSSVHHLVSVVTGQMRPGLGAVDLLRACFPGGSITGAPKIRAMEIINALEPLPRGPYCGTAFRLGVDGSFDSSILIRSLMMEATGRVVAQAGGGIVADSDPASEYHEALTKVAPLLAAVAGPDTETPA